MAQLGLVPHGICKKFGINIITSNEPTCKDSICCSYKKCDGDLINIDSSEKWNSMIESSKSTPTLVKFTAVWCKPCKEITPFFLSLSSKIKLSEVDVDCEECQSVVEEFRVVMMPTFISELKQVCFLFNYFECFFMKSYLFF